MTEKERRIQIQNYSSKKLKLLEQTGKCVSPGMLKLALVYYLKIQELEPDHGWKASLILCELQKFLAQIYSLAVTVAALPMSPYVDLDYPS